MPPTQEDHASPSTEAELSAPPIANATLTPDHSHERKIIVIFAVFALLIFGGLLIATRFTPGIAEENADIQAASSTTTATPEIVLDRRFDLNGSATVDTRDVSLIAASIREMRFDPRLDMNSDGIVDVRDLSMIRTALATGSHVAQFDLSQDGTFDNRDIQIVARVLTEMSNDPYADINADGAIDANDLAHIRRALAEDPGKFFDLSLDGSTDNQDVRIVSDVMRNMSNDPYADLSSDGAVSADDLRLIRAYMTTLANVSHDLDLDGDMDNADVRIVADVLRNMSNDPYADIDADGAVTTSDLYEMRVAVRRDATGIGFFDLDLDGQVDKNDRSIIMSAIESRMNDPYADLTADGVVDTSDLDFFDTSRPR